MKPERIYTAYKITNTVNQQCYVGVTGRTLKVRWQEHVSHALRNLPGPPLFHDAIRRLGADAFAVTALATTTAAENRWALERRMIAEHRAYPDGYNVLPGVPQSIDDPGVPKCFTKDRDPMPEAQRQRMRDLFMGRVDSPETLARKKAAQQDRAALGLNHGRGKLTDAEKTMYSLRRAGAGRVTYAGVEYSATPAAAVAAGVTAATMRRWVKHFGRDVPLVTEHMRQELRWNRRPVVIDGTQYAQLSDAATSLGVSLRKIRHWAKIGRAQFQSRPMRKRVA